MNLETETSTDPVDDALSLLDDMADETPSGGDDAPRDDATGQDDEEQPDTEAANADDESEESQFERKKPSRAEKRIGQLTRQARDAERERDSYRAEIETMRRDYDRLQAQVQAMQATPDQIRQGRQQGLNEQQVQDLVRKQASELVETERFQATVTTLKKTLEDNGAGEALQRLANPRLTNFEPEAVSALAEAKFPDKVAKAIAGNDEVFDRFSKLKTGVERARFIDRLDGRLESRAAGKAPISEAKPSPRVRGSARKPDKSPDEMNQAEFEAWSKKQGLL